MPSSLEADTAAIRTYYPGNEAQIYAITVGSETLYRGNFTGPQLLTVVNGVKTQFPAVKIGIADSWNKYADGTADPVILGGVDFLFVNAFGFWSVYCGSVVAWLGIALLTLITGKVRP